VAELALRDFPPADGPYETWIGRRPALERHGQPRQHASIARVKLPACEPCNGELDRRFEKPAKSILRQVMASDARGTLTASEAMQCTLWFLKTWLFLASPAAISSDPAITRKGWEGAPEDLWSWTIDGRPPPAGLSLWMHRPTAQPGAHAQPQYLMLPTVIADGEEMVFRVHEQGSRWAPASSS
jgi:hypothetical protein